MSNCRCWLSWQSPPEKVVPTKRKSRQSGGFCSTSSSSWRPSAFRRYSSSVVVFLAVPHVILQMGVVEKWVVTNCCPVKIREDRARYNILPRCALLFCRRSLPASENSLSDPFGALFAYGIMNATTQLIVQVLIIANDIPLC